MQLELTQPLLGTQPIHPMRNMTPELTGKDEKRLVVKDAVIADKRTTQMTLLLFQAQATP